MQLFINLEPAVPAYCLEIPPKKINKNFKDVRMNSAVGVSCLGGPGTQQLLPTFKINCSSFDGFNICILPAWFFPCKCSKHLKFLCWRWRWGVLSGFCFCWGVGRARKSSSLPFCVLELSTCSKTSDLVPLESSLSCPVQHQFVLVSVPVF